MVTGIDLVQAQLRIAAGEPLWISQEQIDWRGHAIQCRINAEDPADSFRPAFGTLTEYVEPAGFGVRVDSGVCPGYAIPQYYDSLLAKLVAWGRDRDEAIARMRRALADYRIGGVVTTIPFHQLALAHPAFVRGEATVNFIPRYLANQLKHVQAAAAADQHAAESLPSEVPAEPARTFAVEVNGRRFNVRVVETGASSDAEQPGGNKRSAPSGKRSAQPRPSLLGHRSASTNGVVSSLQGTIIAVHAAPGQEVEAGQVLFIIEAMKMENEIAATHSGTLNEVRVVAGQVVEPGSVLATYQ
jgi:acetyl-CoA/propionyl-CoA/long-chain acyl-CoA carboxylase, biotin carboxylase, biotin carboxyl carrier protein